MNMKIYFPGGKKVYADFNDFTHVTDQPTKVGGDGTAPPPFDLFLASIGTCAGIYVLEFCQRRNIPTQGIEISQDIHYSMELKRVEKIDIEIKLPADFPEKYRTAIVQAANLCTVKKHLESPPQFNVFSTLAG
jgi:ribosomal protein S12 methylthiotransferase accessory factor